MPPDAIIYAIPYGHRMRAERQHLLLESPSWFRELTRPAALYRIALLDIIQRNSAFARFICDLRVAGREHFLFAALAFARAHRLGSDQRHHLGHRLLTVKRMTLLSELSGVPWSNAALNIVLKLSPSRPASPVFYLSIPKLMTRRPAAKLLSHAPELSVEAVRAARDLPSGALGPKVLGMITAYELTDSIVRTVRRIWARIPEVGHDALFASLKEVDDPEKFDRWDRLWSTRVLQYQGFPDPPFPGDEFLQPLTSCEAMIREGRRMRNCVGDYMLSIGRRDFYFYHWSLGEHATVKVAWSKRFGWYVKEARGIANRALTRATRSAIKETVDRLLGARKHRPPQ